MSGAQILIIPGYGAGADSNWFPWLASKAKAYRQSALVFNPPSPTVPRLSDWLSAMKLDIDQLGSMPIIIGHSLGCVAALHAVERYELCLKKLILVAPPYDPMDVSQIKNFFTPKINFSNIIKSSKEIVILGSEDDWIVPIDHIKSYGKRLKTRPIVLPQSGHFMSLSFPEILPLIFD